MKNKLNYKLIIIIMFIITLFGEILNINLIIPKICLFVICLIFCKNNDILKYYIIFNTFSSGTLLYITNMAFFVIYLMRKSFKLNRDNNSKYFIIIGIFEILHIILLVSYKLPTSIILEQLMCGITFTVFAFLLGDKELQKDNEELIKCFVLSTLLVVFIFLLKKINYYGINNIFNLANGIGKIPTDRAYSLVSNANGVSRKMGISLVLLLDLFINKKINMTRFIVGIISCICLGIMSYSLSFILLIVVVSCCILLYMLFKNKTKNSLFKIFFIIVLVLIIFVLLKNTNIYQKIYKIFYKSITATDISNGRIDIYKYYLNILSSKPAILIFGGGLTTYQIILSNGVTELAAHNCFLEVVLSWGLVGLCVFLTYFIKLLKCSIKIKNKTTLMLLISLLIYMMIGNFFIGYYSNLIIFLVIHLSLDMNMEEINNGEKTSDKIASIRN